MITYYRNFKHLPLVILITVSISSSFADNKLLKCLGNEELRIHRLKLEGPVYRLNQKLIGEISSAGKITIKPQYFKSVCNNKTFSPSVKLLKILLINGVSIVKKPDLTNIPQQYAFSSFKEIVKKAPDFLFGYLAELQALTNDPHCLKKKIPELDYFRQRFLYLQGDFSNNQLLDDKKKISAIFKRLERFGDILRSCNKK